jgi:protein ImuB
VTLARIRAIVGEENVGRAVLQDTHRPEAFRIEPFALPSGSPSVHSPSTLQSATRRLRPLENILVTVQGRHPKAFVFRDKSYVVNRAYGPWLASGDWWNPTLWGQEQWDIEAHAQDSTLLRCCIVRDQMANCWQMTALYD